MSNYVPVVLESCPNCGGKAVLWGRILSGIGRQAWVECTQCHMKGPANVDLNAHILIDQWNKRTETVKYCPKCNQLWYLSESDCPRCKEPLVFSDKNVE